MPPGIPSRAACTPATGCSLHRRQGVWQTTQGESAQQSCLPPHTLWRVMRCVPGALIDGRCLLWCRKSLQAGRGGAASVSNCGAQRVSDSDPEDVHLQGRLGLRFPVEVGNQVGQEACCGVALTALRYSVRLRMGCCWLSVERRTHPRGALCPTHKTLPPARAVNVWPSPLQPVLEPPPRNAPTCP